MPLLIPKWVPEAARLRIHELEEDAALGDVAREVLDRLACTDAMKAGVWDKLPPERVGATGSVIDWAVWAVVGYANIVPAPYGKKSTILNWSKYIDIRRSNNINSSPGDISNIIKSANQSILQSKAAIEKYIEKYWKGPTANVDNFLRLSVTMSNILDDYQKVIECSLQLVPIVRRPYSDNSHEVFFSQCMSICMKNLYGRYFDAVVSCLAEVALGLPMAPGVEVIRARRRETQLPEKSR